MDLIQKGTRWADEKKELFNSIADICSISHNIVSEYESLCGQIFPESYFLLIADSEMFPNISLRFEIRHASCYGNPFCRCFIQVGSAVESRLTIDSDELPESAQLKWITHNLPIYLSEVRSLSSYLRPMRERKLLLQILSDKVDLE